MLESLYDKVADLKIASLLKKKTPTQVFSCDYCEFFENNYFEEYLRMAASGNTLRGPWQCMKQ